MFPSSIKNCLIRVSVAFHLILCSVRLFGTDLLPRMSLVEQARSDSETEAAA